MATDDGPVVFETVKQRFDDATAALEELHGTLQSLQRADETQKKATAAVTGASERLQEMIDATEESCELLRLALDKTREALASAENLATGAELTAIRTGVEAVETRVTDMLADDATLATTGARVEDIRSRIEQMLADDATLATTGSQVNDVHTWLKFLVAEEGTLATLDSSLTDVHDLISDRLEKSEQDLNATNTELAAAKERLTMIESRLATVPEKIRRKFNLAF